MVVHKYIGEYFTHPETGKTLYVNTDGECTGDCLSEWEPYISDSKRESGSIGVVLRTDTKDLQYTWNGQALYTFKNDTIPGEVLGDGFDSVWMIARP